jgi:hypothetical protein
MEATMNPDVTHALAQIPPLATRAAGMLLFTLSALMLGVHTLIVTAASERADLPPRTRLLAPLLTTAALAVWFGVAITVGDGVNFPLPADLSRLAVVLAALLVPLVAGIAMIFGSRTLRAVNAATPPEWLIWAQSYRMAGFIFLFPFLYYGVVPADFAVPAAVGDMLVGALAPAVGLGIARGARNARTWAIAWNVLGIVDLVAAPTLGILSGARIAFIYPLVMVPLFVGPPLAILTHVLSLRNLAVTRPDRREARMGEVLPLGAER